MAVLQAALESIAMLLTFHHETSCVVIMFIRFILQVAALLSVSAK